MRVIPFLVLSMVGVSLAKETGEIVHDAEYYILEAQNEKNGRPRI